MDMENRRAVALEKAIAYCANQDELSGKHTPPDEVLKVAETFEVWLAQPATGRATPEGGPVSGGVASSDA